MTKYTYKWRTGYEEFQIYEKEYKKLCKENKQVTLFNSWEWLNAFCESYLFGTRQLVFLTVIAEGTLVAFVPFSYGKENLHGLPITSLRLLGDPMSDRQVLVSLNMEGLLSYILELIQTTPYKSDLIALCEIPGDSYSYKSIKQWISSNTVNTRMSICSSTPVVNLNYTDAQELLSNYSKSLKTLIKRAQNKLKKADIEQGYSVEEITPSPDSIEELLCVIKAIEDKSWKGEKEVGVFSGKNINFIKNISQKLSNNGWLKIYLLHFNGEIISYRFGFLYNNVYYDYNLAYLPEYSKFSPGRVLLDGVVRSSCESGVSVVDASRASLKKGHQLQEWPCHFIDHFQLWIFGRTILGTCLSFLYLKLKPVISNIKNFINKKCEDKL